LAIDILGVGVGHNKKVKQEYIQNQIQEDMIADQISVKGYKDPFKGDE